MQISKLAKYAVGVTTAAALLAGCSSGGNSPVSPAGMQPLRAVRLANGLLTLAAHPAAPGAHTVGLVNPDKKHHKHHKKRQYITNFYSSTALEFDYPKGDSSIGSISLDEPQGMCSDTSTHGVAKKTFWVTNSGSDDIEQFTWSGTATGKTLSESVGEAASCAIDPTTHNIAITVLDAGDVVVFNGGTGSGTPIADGFIETFFAGYDASGDLYVDGLSSFGVGVAELPKGSSAFETLTTSNTLEFPGGVQWDGQWITIDDQDAHAIYQYNQSGTSLTVEGTTSLTGSGDCVDTWIATGYVICPDAENNDGLIFPYPAGGSSTATLTGSFDTPISGMDAER